MPSQTAPPSVLPLLAVGLLPLLLVAQQDDQDARKKAHHIDEQHGRMPEMIHFPGSSPFHDELCVIQHVSGKHLHVRWGVNSKVMEEVGMYASTTG